MFGFPGTISKERRRYDRELEIRTMQLYSTYVDTMYRQLLVYTSFYMQQKKKDQKQKKQKHGTTRLPQHESLQHKPRHPTTRHPLPRRRRQRPCLGRLPDVRQPPVGDPPTRPACTRPSPSFSSHILTIRTQPNSETVHRQYRVD